MLPRLARPLSTLRRWLRHSWLSRLPLFPPLRACSKSATPPRKPRTHQPQLEGYEERSSFSDPGLLNAVMPLASVGLLAAPLLTPSAVLREGTAGLRPESLTPRDNPLLPAAADLVFASWSTPEESPQSAFEAALGPEEELPPGALGLVRAEEPDPGPLADKGWLDGLAALLEESGQSEGTGFAGLPGLTSSAGNGAGMRDGYERGAQTAVWDGSAQGMPQTRPDDPYAYPGLFDSWRDSLSFQAGGPAGQVPAATGHDSGQALAPIRPPAPTLRPDFGAMPLAFEPNRGQSASDALFVGRAAGYRVALAPTAAVLAVGRPAGHTPRQGEPPNANADAIRLRLVGANANARLEARTDLLGRSNYFRGGEDPLALSDVPHYAQVLAHDVYQGIDVLYQGDGQSLRFDLLLDPGADPGLVKLSYQGARSIRLDEQGRLRLGLPGGELVQHAPVAFQEDAAGQRQLVTARFVAKEAGHFGFEVGAYDRSRRLVIDPTLSFTALAGGDGANLAQAVAVDAAGAVYLAGTTEELDLPSTPGAFSDQGSLFVSRYSPTGVLVYTTMLGDDGGTGLGLAVDAAGSAFVTGSASDSGFPTTAGAFRTSGAGLGGLDGVAAKLSPAGNQLIWASYLPGNGDDSGRAIAVDAAGYAYVGGQTSSTNFATVAALSGSRQGDTDGFLTRLAPDGKSALFSTYIGASGDEAVHGVAVDVQGRVYLAGRTTSSSGLASVGAYDTTLAGDSDAFLMRVSADGQAKDYASYYGGTGDETAYGLGLDSLGRASLAGVTTSTDLATVSPYQASSAGGEDAFVVRLGAGSSTPSFASYYGGSGDEAALALAVGTAGELLLGGRTTSTNFPVLNAVQGSFGSTGSDPDGFLVALDATTPATRLYATYLGGSAADVVHAVARDADFNALAAGQTFSSDFPGAAAYAGGGDAFLSRLERLAAPVLTAISGDTGSSSSDELTSDQTLTLSGTAAANATLSVYRAGQAVALGTTTANGSGAWSYDYSATSLAEGSYAFWATQTAGGLSSRPSTPVVVSVDRTAPVVTLEMQASTYDLTPEVLVTAWDLHGVATTVTLDVDLNNDNDFSDASETGYASATLAAGAALFHLSPALSLGTVKVRARVNDRAGNEGTSATQTVEIAASPTTWPVTIATRTADALLGDSLLQLGTLNLTHTLDLDLSPGSGSGPSLSYNSERVDPQPPLAVRVQSDNAIALPPLIELGLVWNEGTSYGLGLFSTTGLSPGDAITVAIQPPPQAAPTTGRYTYTLTASMEYPTPIVRSVGGHIYLVAEPDSPFGAGWTMAGVDRLVDIAEDEDNNLPAGKLRVYGGSGASFYEGTGPFSSPAGDPGTLTTITGGYRYESPDGWRREFDSSGYQTLVRSPDGSQLTTYTWSSGRLTGIQSPDGALSTLTYNGANKLSTIQTGTRTVTVTVDGSGHLVGITNPDGGLRTFSYSGQRLSQDSFGVLGSAYSYSDGLLTSYTPSGGSAHTVTPSVLAGLTAAHAGTVRSAFSDGAGRSQTWKFDPQGRAEEQIAGDGGLTRWTRDATNKWVTGFTDALGRATTLTLDSKGYVTGEALPDGSSRAYEYDATHHGLTKITDERGQVTTVTYSGTLPETVIDPLGNRTTQVWSNGLLQSVKDALGRVTTYLYDSARRLETTIDALGGRVTLTYDAHGNVTTRKDPLGRVTTYSNDALGRILNTISALGARTTAVHDASGLLLSSRDALNILSLYQYDGTGQQTSAVEASGTPAQRSLLSVYDGAGLPSASRDANGAWSSTSYDGVGRANEFTDAHGSLSRAYHDRAGQQLGGIDALGQGSQHEHNSRGWITKSTDALGGVSTNVYDAVGNLTGTINALGQRTSHVYDNVNRRVSTTEAVGTAEERTSTVVYDAVGNVYQEVDWLGRTTQYEYDALNRLTRLTQALGTAEERVATYAYDAVGNHVGHTDFRGFRSESTYDAQNRRTVFKEAVGTSEARTATTVYDLVGNVTSAIDALGRTASFAYDALHRRIAATEAVGTSVARTTSTLWDAVGRVVGQVNALGEATQMAHDALGQPIWTGNALGQGSRTFFDGVGNATGWQDANGHRGTAVYDSLNRAIRAEDALGRVTTSVYDALGNLIAQVNARGYRTTYSYDGLNRLVQVQDALGGLASTVYDKADNVLAQVDQLGRRTSFAYDNLNQQVATLDALGQRATTVYDDAGNVEGTIDPLGRRTSHVYDSLNRHVATVDALANRTTSVYDALDNVLAWVDALGHRTTTLYDALNRAEASLDALGNRTTAVYDAADRLVAQLDALGRRTTFLYDRAGRRTGQVDALSWQASTAYDQAGNVVSRTDPAGKVTSYAYDALNRVQEVTDALGAVTSTVYDEVGNVSATVDARGYRSTTIYDALDRPEVSIDALGNRTTNVYDAVGNLIAQVNARGYRTTSVYDVLNRREATVDALGNRTSTVYDAVSNVLAQVNALNQRTSFAYDALDRPITHTNALNQVASTVYDAVGNVQATTNARGHTTSYTYDARQRLIQTQDALGNLSSTVYDAVGNAIVQVDARGYRTTSVYDALNRVIARQDSQGRTTSVLYDSVGRVEATIDALGKRTSFAYDAVGRQTKVTDAGGGVATTVYDAVGNAVNSIDASGNRSTVVYDALNRPSTQTDARGAVVSLLHDAVGNNTAVIDPVGNRTTFVYDALDRVIEETDPQNKTATTAYDALGRVASSTDRLGQRRDYTFDAAGRQTGEVWKAAGGATINTRTFTWDAAGNRTSAADSAGAYTFAYDEQGRLTSAQGLFGLVLTHTYDAVGNRTRTQDSKGGVTTSVYNAVNLLTRREFGGAGQTPLRFDQTYTDRDELGGVTRYSDLAGTTVVGTTSHTYDDSGRMLTIHHKDGSGTSLVRATYVYDVASRLTHENIDGSGRTFTYDAANQLTAAGSDGYSFDLNGNRTMSGYTTDTGNRLTNDGTWTYTYDDAGQRSKKSKGALLETWTYGYNHKGQMSWAEQRATDGGALQLKLLYTYDMDGNRVGEDRWTQATGTVTTRFGYDGTDVWVDLDGSNALQMRYVRPDGIDALAARLPGAGGTVWYLTDRQGTVLANTNATGAVVNRNTYSGFGAPLTQTDPTVAGRYLYTAKEYQADVRLQHNDARYYDPFTGRWTTIDPIGFQAGDNNLYRYVSNGPTLSTDPSGLQGPGPVLRPTPRPALTPVRPVGPTADTIGPDRPSRDILEDLKVSPTRRGPAVESTPTDIWEQVRRTQHDERRRKIVEQAAREAKSEGVPSDEIYRILNERRFCVDLDQATSIIVGELRSASQRDRRKQFESMLNTNYYRKTLNFIVVAIGVPQKAIDTTTSDDEVLRLIKRHIEDLGWRGRDSDALRRLASKLRQLELARELRPGNEKENIQLARETEALAYALLDPEGQQRVIRAMLKGAEREKGACFAAGTMLLTPTGSTRIELLRPGDLVLARPEHDAAGQVEAKVVEEAFVTTERLYHIHVGGQVIRTTPEHPFYVQDKGWLAASDLQAGDRLSTHEGKGVVVEDVVATGEYETVYNVRVADFHTYFVGCDEWGFSVWAHNKCWYHGTDSSETVSTKGLNKADFEANEPEEPDKGFFVTPDKAYAEATAILKTKARNAKNKTNNTPVVLVADDAVIGPFLKPTSFTNLVGAPEFGEMVIPVEDFDKVPRNAFRRTP